MENNDIAVSCFVVKIRKLTQNTVQYLTANTQGKTCKHDHDQDNVDVENCFILTLSLFLLIMLNSRRHYTVGNSVKTFFLHFFSS